jgi:hypothetical protein
MATVAVFVALGGGAYALTAPKGSVTSKSVKNQSLKGKDVAPDTLTGSDVLESSLIGVTGPRGLEGQEGDEGPQGPPGPTAAAVRSLSDPTASPEMPNYVGTATVSAPTAGRIYAMASGAFTLTCTAGTGRIGLYVDGVPVPESEITINGSEDAFFFGLTGSVAAGDRAITIGYDCPSGTPMATAHTSVQIGGIFVGP